MKNQATAIQTKSTQKPGFFKRIVDKLDSSLKEKADAKSEQPCCGSSARAKGKGGKCC